MERELVCVLDESVDQSGKYAIFSAVNGLVMIKNEKTYEKYCEHVHQLHTLEKWLQEKDPENPMLCPKCKLLIDLEDSTLKNKEYRKLVYRDKNTELFLMSLDPQKQVPLEVHKKTTQFIVIEQGIAEVIINNKIHDLRAGEAIFIPMGMKHEVINMSKFETLKFYTTYSPPVH